MVSRRILLVLLVCVLASLVSVAVAAAPIKSLSAAANRPVDSSSQPPLSACYSSCQANTTQCISYAKVYCEPFRLYFQCLEMQVSECDTMDFGCRVDCRLDNGDPVEREYMDEFNAYVEKYNRTQDVPSEPLTFFSAYAAFKTNLDLIRHHNANGSSSFTLGINEFADTTFYDFRTMFGYDPIVAAVQPDARSPPLPPPHLRHLRRSHQSPSLDWRTKGVVTPVRNQADYVNLCNGSWAFSATGSAESVHAMRTGQLVELSESQLYDCAIYEDPNNPNWSDCSGAPMVAAFEYLTTNSSGLVSESSYPSPSAGGNDCLAGGMPVVANFTGGSFVRVATGSESALLAAVALGPVSVAIAAVNPLMQFYSGGILSEAACGDGLSHGVLVVGFGTEKSTETPYWIVKNSWGTTWGEEGYTRIARGRNVCGIADAAAYLVV